MTTEQLIQSFNKPHQCAVAINTEHIGDDNDYSCFLFDVIMKVFPTDEKMAFKLYKTDPMQISNIDFETFKINIQGAIKRHNEILSMHNTASELCARMTD